MATLSAKALNIKYEALRSERANLDTQLELIERFVVPGRGRFFQEGQDHEQSINWRDRELYDGTAQNSAIMLAAFTHGNLTSASLDWFNPTFKGKTLKGLKDAKEWLEECGSLQKASLNESNLDLEIQEQYLDSCSMGTGYMMHDELKSGLDFGGHYFKSQMMRQCYFEEDMDGNPVGFFIKRTYSPTQLAIKFGIESLPADIAQKLENPGISGDNTEDLIYCVYLDIANMNADVSQVLVPERRPYVGRYVLTRGQQFIGDEQRFYEFPAYVLRWARTAGSKYGHSPGIVALGDILTLQEMVRLNRTATEKTVDPPMKTTRRGIIGDLRLSAGGLTMVRDMDGLAPLMPANSYRVENGWRDIQDLRKRIEQYFFIDQLQLKESPQMTATEVRVRYEIMQRMLGPTLGRITSDLLDPLVKRSFWMMYRKKAFPRMPDSVAENKGELVIEYTGPLARAQMMGKVDGITRWLSLTSEMSQVPGMEEITDVPDADKVSNLIARILGVPEEVIRSEGDVKNRRAKRTKDRELAQQLAAAESASTSAKNMAQAGAAGGEGMAQGPQGIQ